MVLKYSLLLLTVIFGLSFIQGTHGAASLATELIGLQSEVRKLKSTSDVILGDVRRVKELSTGLQNDMKRIHSELRILKTMLTDFKGLQPKDTPQV